jgi:type 1 glutamine amidotransferase
MKTIIYRCFLTVGLLTGLCFGGQSENIKALLVTGQNNHNWQVSHVAIKKILENSGLFTVDVALSPKEGQDMSRFAPDFKSYQLVIVDYNGDSWPEETNKHFVEYAANGGGIVFYHAADNAFPDWKAYNEMIALGGWNNRNEKSGPWVYWENGRLVKNNGKGNGGSHGDQHEFVLNGRNKTNPIMAGLPDNWKHAQDELYDRMRGPGNIKDVLYTAYSDLAKKGSGREEPILFTVNFGKARIFHTMLGHAGATLEKNTAMQCTGFQVTLLRGCEWAATGKVTQSVPADFPKADKVSLRPNYRYYPKPMEMEPEMSEFWLPQPAIVTPGSVANSAFISAPSDAVVLFDGKDLSKWKETNGKDVG